MSSQLKYSREYFSLEADFTSPLTACQGRSYFRICSFCTVSYRSLGCVFLIAPATHTTNSSHTYRFLHTNVRKGTKAFRSVQKRWLSRLEDFCCFVVPCGIWVGVIVDWFYLVLFVYPHFLSRIGKQRSEVCIQIYEFLEVVNLIMCISFFFRLLYNAIFSKMLVNNLHVIKHTS